MTDEKTRTCRYHCVHCELLGRPCCFTSLAAFDAHIFHDGPRSIHENARAVTYGPHEVRLTAVSGECRLANRPGPTTLYTTHG